MKLQRLLSLIRQAVDQYEMIEEGDHIAIGISGGKDSLTLLWGLAHLQKFYPKHFSLSAITVDMGIDTMTVSYTHLDVYKRQAFNPFYHETILNSRIHMYKL